MICLIQLFFFSNGCNVLINPTSKIVILHGSTEISTENGIFDFSRVEVYKSLTVIFTIQNNGNTDLKLTGSTIIVISGTDASNFIVTSQPALQISPKKETTFRIKFTPNQSKYYSANVSITNNDADKTPYTFSLTGRGIIIDINVRQGTNIFLRIQVFLISVVFISVSQVQP